VTRSQAVRVHEALGARKRFAEIRSSGHDLLVTQDRGEWMDEVGHFVEDVVESEDGEEET
jgi:hypothetical protein